MNPPPPLPKPLPPAFGFDPYESALFSKPAPPPVNVDYLAFGSGLVTQDPRYRPANLPPFR